LAWKSCIRNEDITKSDPGATMRSRSRRRQRSDRPRIQDRKGGYTYLSFVRTTARYSRMAARSGEVLEDNGEPILADGDDDGRGL